MKVGQRTAQDLCYEQGYDNPCGSHPTRWMRTVYTRARTDVYVLHAMDDALFMALPSPLQIIDVFPAWMQRQPPSPAAS